MADLSVLDKENVGILQPSKSLGKRPAELEAANGEQAKRKAVLRPSTRVTIEPNAGSEQVRDAQPAAMGPPPPRPKPAAIASAAVRPYFPAAFSNGAVGSHPAQIPAPG
jgi:hypothetical protein